MNEEIDIILARYLNGEATQKELQTLDKWLAKSEENENYFHEMTLLYQYSGQQGVLPNFDTEKAFSQFKTHIAEKQKISSSFKFSYMLKAAAVVAILLSATFTFLYFYNHPKSKIQITASETTVEHTIFLNTKVTLFKGSKIIYDAKKENEISLKGKAVFKVDSKTSVANIVVQAGETFIKDIGTIFTVDATEPDKLISVEVSEGEVWFYTNINTGVQIKQNESAVYDVKKKQFTMVDIPLCATSNHDIIFQNTPLKEAIEIIEKRYSVHIIINPEKLTGLFLNASFDKDESVENIMEIISATIGANLSKKDGSYILTQ